MSVEPVLGGGATRTASRGGSDETSQSWVSGIRSTGVGHDDCIARFHTVLLRVAHFEVFRSAGSLGLAGPELDHIAQQARDDALMAIKAKIGDFRGERRFTTWAYRFVMFEVSAKMGRHFWRHRPAELDDGAWERLPDTLAVAPDARAEDRELFGVLRKAIEEDLTDLQRRVFVAVAVNEEPMDVFARIRRSRVSRPRSGRSATWIGWTLAQLFGVP